MAGRPESERTEPPLALGRHLRVQEIRDVKLMALGVDHRTAPTSVREALAFDGDRRASSLRALNRLYPQAEAVVLSTCNRVELYVGGDSSEVMPNADNLTTFLAEFHGLSPDAFASHIVHYHDEGVVGHLFRVASSVESLVLGEGQILGQVKEAYQAAVETKTVGPIFHALFQHALRVGKKVRESTGLDQGRLSIASVAVDVARDVFDSFADKTVLVIGAGKMAELTLRHLRSTVKPGRLLVTNRNPARAQAVAERFGGETRPFEQLGQALIESDLIISTTAAEQPIVGRETFARVQRARRHRLILIVDIAIPRDFDPGVGDLEQVLLYNLDDLQAQSDLNRQGRNQGLVLAEEIIERETSVCLATLRHQRHAGALLHQLGEYADQLRQRELDRLYASRPNLSEADRQAIDYMAHRLQNQFLHHPRKALRDATVAPQHPEHPHSLIHAVRHLFGLGD